MATLDIWGPNVWRSIHFIALGYPKKPTFEDKENYKNFFNSLGPVLPCSKCSLNFKRHMDEIPIDMYLHNGQLFAWTVKLHNLVNKENEKPEISVTQAKSLLLSKDHDLVKKGAVGLIVVIVILVGLWIWLKKW